MKPIEVSECFMFYKAFCANFEPVEIWRVKKNHYFICRKGTKDIFTEYMDNGNGDYVEGWLNGSIKALHQLKRKEVE